MHFLQTPKTEFAKLTEPLKVLPEAENKFTARLTHTAAGRVCLSLKELTSIKMDVWQSVI